MYDLYYEAIESIAIEGLCKKGFGVDISVKQIITLNMPTSKGSVTTVFQDHRYTLYALCVASAPLALADVKQIMHGAGIEAETYLPPHGDPAYFANYGQKAFCAAFPGRKPINQQDTAFYQTLAPYNPALVRVSKIKGELRQYIAPTQRWQTAEECSYKRLQVQQR